MISYTRDPQQTIPTSSVKIIGLGGAGANMLERIALDGLDGAELLALNTDVRTLAACLAGEKIQLGVNLTKGLGAGGDPELGQQAMLEAENEIRASLQGRRIVFLCTGLGGGTGSGAAPIITRIAREEGAFVVVFATMPFAFEGRRRREQAETALNELAVLSNALVTFDNNRMGELVLAKQGIHEAFAAADHMICESIKAVIRLVVRPGLINVGLDDLMSALRTTRSRCLFGSGIANGKDRAARALRNALSSPLLDQGALLKDAQTVLVHLSGGEDLTLFEIELLMQKLLKFVPEKAHVLFGAAIDPSMGDSLSITLISALPEDSLASAPREALSKSTPESPILDPSDGFTRAPTKVEPEQEPEPTPEPKPTAAEEREPMPAAQPVSPLAKFRRPAAADEPAVSLFEGDERPFAEPEPETQPEAKPEPKAQPETAPKAPAEIDIWDDLDKPAPEPTKPATAEADAFTFSTTPEPEEAAPPAKPAAFSPVPKKRPTEASPWSRPPSRDEDPATPETDDSASPAAPGKPADTLADPPKLKLGVKTAVPQSELSFDSAPRGRFEGEKPNVVDGEDLDLPPFLRKKK
jgi:cell division protein FtsZ